MDLDFHEIEYDNLSEMSTEELRDLVGEFREAQEENIDQFEQVVDRMEEFQSADADLAQRVAEETSLPESEAQRLSFSGKRELLDTETETEDETQTRAGSGEQSEEFNDMGQSGETHSDEDSTAEPVEQAFDRIGGVEL